MSFREIPYKSLNFSNPPYAYIINENSFQNDIDYKMFINNLNSPNVIPNIIKTDFTFDEIITLKNFNKGFYVISANRLSALMKGIKRKFISKANLIEINGEKILYFFNDCKFIVFEPKILAQSL